MPLFDWSDEGSSPFGLERRLQLKYPDLERAYKVYYYAMPGSEDESKALEEYKLLLKLYKDYI